MWLWVLKSGSVCMLSYFSHVQFFVTPWTVAHQVPLFSRFSRQGYWSGLSWPPPGDLPNPGIKPMSLIFFALAGRFFTTGITWEAPQIRKVLGKLDWVYHISFNPDLSDSRTHAIKHKTKTCPQGDLSLIGELNMGTDTHHIYWEGLLL